LTATQTSETGTESSPRGGSGLVWVVEEVAVVRGSAVVDVELACRAPSTGRTATLAAEIENSRQSQLNLESEGRRVRTRKERCIERY
jgi:hypothetical protein